MFVATVITTAPDVGRREEVFFKVACSCSSRLLCPGRCPGSHELDLEVDASECSAVGPFQPVLLSPLLLPTTVHLQNVVGAGY